MIIRMLVLAALVLAVPTSADVVEMKDGRSFEGEIIEETSTHIRIDARVTPTIRATLTLEKSEIDTYERKPLPPGFFDPPEKAEPRVSKPDAFDDDDNHYLVIPIVGRIGEQVFADGVKQGILYARRHRVPHVVFVIESEGGSVDEARRIYKAMSRYHGDVQFHALIRNCRGGALAIPVWCDTLTLAPGAQIGGSYDPHAGTPAEVEQEQVIRSQVANEVAKDVTKRGGRGELIRAMIDPLETLVGWFDENQVVQLGVAPPLETPEDRIIFRTEVGDVLVLAEGQALALGLQSCSGSPESLGAALEFENWTKESDYGETTMAKVAASRQRRAAAETARFNERVQKNIERREMADRYISNNLQQAANWNPSNASYDDYGKRWKWHSGGFYTTRSTWDMGARQRWRDRTDATLHYLSNAATGIRTAIALDQEAVELGLEPTFKPGELEMMGQDLLMKADYLRRNRNRYQ